MVSSSAPLRPQRWSSIELDYSDGLLSLSVEALDGCERFALESIDGGDMDSDAGLSSFCLAAITGPQGRHSHFDGKIARPEIRDGGRIAATWAMGSTPASRTVVDTSGNQRHGTLLNRPQKGMTGPEWAGDSSGWSEVPEQYDAVAFHRDDLSDAGWPGTFDFTVPEDLPSGVYGFELCCGECKDTIPFFVTPPAGTRTAPIAFVVPVFSYLAYANERHWWPNPGIEAIAGAPLEEIVGPMERWAEEQELLSLYDYHSDGTGNAHASLRRPLVNVRHDYRHPLLRGPHQLSGDIITLDWLRRTGQPVDILTDYCLHERGAEALRDYQCVITGSHPEYVTTQILDAFEVYATSGGNIMHMGGNAFYFVVSVYEEEPHIIEVRRGPGGTIPWQSAPGEFRQAATGELGGLWRWRGRSAHSLFGTGTSAVSFEPARPFVIEPSALDNQATAWIFEGIDGPQVNSVGKLFGGAAGFEMDAMRHDLGTPWDTVKLAQAGDFGAMAFQAIEDVIGTGPLCEAFCHLAYRKLHSGGQIFSAPSISWTSCLSDDTDGNPVALITSNVLGRFLRGDEEKRHA
ncbi:N,N-dimethylformamidase beta subunit family domain-containing protein [Kineobactrum salinum]|uniref:N,N-dimethylformamidase beta subunit-like C-terminal domain-containing protein n=1 Tax=Kineobactrum salinum TaxID=2708301 RepID=A0A6C0U0M1_9GAMM|nr:N,N-dimethylformamidase beta subunit family domain-containing protein [Kineobactrum salinum]QIB65556.1 hypothetical protein G3T16_09220 [Kineobactrum salinum]